MELRLALWSVLPAAVAAGVLLTLAWRPWRRPASSRGALALGGLACAVGYALGHLQGDLDLPWPPREATHRFFWLALGAGAVGALLAPLGPSASGPAADANGPPSAAATAPARATPIAPSRPELGRRLTAPARPELGRRVTNVLVRVLTAVLVPWWFLSTFVARWETARAALTVGGLALGLLLLWTGLDGLARRRPGLTWPLATWGVAAAGSLALLESGNATYALCAASLAGVLGAAGVVALLHPGVRFAGGAAAVVSVVLACLWIGGTFLSELPPLAAVLLGLAPLAAWVRELPAVRARGPRLAAALALLAALLPAAAALALAVVQAPEPYDY